MCFRLTKGSGAVEKVTWHGSGAHIPNVMNDYPQSEWCTCTPKFEWRDPGSNAVQGVGGDAKGEEKGGFEYPPGGEKADRWFKRWVGFEFSGRDGDRMGEEGAGWDGGCFVAG